MGGAELLSRIAAELALFAGVGFLLFGLNDLLVDLIYFGRRAWRAVTVYSRYPREYGSNIQVGGEPPWFAIFVPAWDEASVIAPMLQATLQRLDYPNYRIFVGHYRNDPATAAAIASVQDHRIEEVLVDVDGPTTKADCLNHLYDALIAYETWSGRSAKAIVLHDSEDVVHPLELTVFARLIDRAGVIQLPSCLWWIQRRTGSADIMVTNSPRRMQRSSSFAKPWVPRSRWQVSAAPLHGSRWRNWQRRMRGGRSPKPA